MMAPGTPPPSDVDCSPGFYKNHVDTWWSVCCDDATNECIDLENALNANGKWMRPLRDAAMNILNNCFGDLGYSPCLDD